MNSKVAGITRLRGVAAELGITNEQMSDFCGYVHDAAMRMKSRFKAVTTEDWVFKDPVFKVAAQVWLLQEYANHGFQARGHCLIQELERQKSQLDPAVATKVEGFLREARATLDDKERESFKRRERIADESELPLDSLSNRNRPHLYGAPPSGPTSSPVSSQRRSDPPASDPHATD